MSAWIVSKAHVDFLLTAALTPGRYSEHGKFTWYLEREPVEGAYQKGEPWGPGHITSIHNRHRELTRENASEVGMMLWGENYASVNHRYDENDIEEIYTFATYRGKVALSPVNVLKSIACYEYQSCEHPEWKQSAAYAFCKALENDWISRVQGYEEAPWGIDA